MKSVFSVSNLGLKLPFLLTTILLVIGTARAAKITVTNTDDNGGGSLRQAVANAIPGDTIDFDLSGCPCTITLTSGQIFIDKSLTLTGPGADALAVSGNNASRIFYIPSGLTVNISGLTLTNGYTSDAHGGAINNSGTLNLIDSRLSANTAYYETLPTYGGGIYNRGKLTITGSTISGNKADFGGGIFNDAAFIDNAITFYPNSVNNSTISGNTATEGGGIINFALLYVNNSTISGNTAFSYQQSYGGGISNRRILYVTNSTISENLSICIGLDQPCYGGGISNRLQSQVYVGKSTISSNTASGGGGIYNEFNLVPELSGEANVNNTIVAANSASGGPDVLGIFASYGFNLISKTDDSSGFTEPSDQTGTGASPLNPMLGPLQNNGGPTRTYALLPGSPAIDKGAVAIDPTTGNPITTDQRGLARTVDLSLTNATGGNGSDIGAFELNDTTPPVITPTVSGTLGGNGWYTSDVQISWSVIDAESAVSSIRGCETQILSYDTGGIFFSCRAASAGGLSAQSVEIKRDATAPVLAPAISPNPVLLNAAATAAPNASDALSGVASASCGLVDTSTAGSHSVACTAADNAGNAATVHANYQVSNVFNFVGFFQPVDNLPALNLATAGSSIPVKFSLGGDRGLAIFAAGYPASSQVQCDASTPGMVIEETVNAGGSSLSYNTETDQYNYVWKTDKSWKGTCRMLIVKFTDGSTQHAKFRFR